MNKYIQQFLDDNNLEVKENFKLEGCNGYYFFDDTGTLWERGQYGINVKSMRLSNLLSGTIKIIKNPLKKFVPQVGQKVWYVNKYGLIDSYIYTKSEMVENLTSQDLFFEIKEECEDYQRFLNILSKYKRTFELGKPNYYFVYNIQKDTICISSTSFTLIQGTVYFGDYQNIQDFISEVGYDKIKRYLFNIWE